MNIWPDHGLKFSGGPEVKLDPQNFEISSRGKFTRFSGFAFGQPGSTILSHIQVTKLNHLLMTLCYNLDFKEYSLGGLLISSKRSEPHESDSLIRSSSFKQP